MFAEFPIVPRQADGVPRFVVFDRGGSSQCLDLGATSANWQRNAEKLLECSFPGPKFVIVFGFYQPVDGCTGCAALLRLVDACQCDAVVVESLSRLSRNPRRLWSCVERLVDAGVRLISLSDHFDSAVDDLSAALAGVTVRTGFNLPIASNSSSRRRS